MLIGFDNQKYLKFQEKAIRDRLAKFKYKFYLEIGGKLYHDFHASRTLPGYDPQCKVLLLQKLKKDLEIIYCVSAKHLASGKIRGDWGVGYDLATLLALEDLKKFGFLVSGVVINRFAGEKEAGIFKKRLERMGYQVYLHHEIESYPEDLGLILSKEGYGKDEYIKTKKPLVIVWGAGPGSGKFSTCLGQLYHDQQKGLDSGYAKFETFPIWDLPLEHPVNLAYEAATADLGDFNLVDPYHLAVYKKMAVNYNRDVEIFPILITLVQKFTHKKNFMTTYHSPTDMGVNMAKRGIVDDKIVKEAAKREIAFYLFRYRQEFLRGLVDEKVLEKMNLLLIKAGYSEEDFPTIKAARRAKKKAEKDKTKGDWGIYCGAALELKNGKIITGKNSPLLHAKAACILNAIKYLAKIPDEIPLLSPQVIESFKEIKVKAFREESKSLELNEVLIALAISGQTNPTITKALEKLPELRDCFIHTTHLSSGADEAVFRKLGIWVTTDGEVSKKKIENERKQVY